MNNVEPRTKYYLTLTKEIEELKKENKELKQNYKYLEKKYKDYLIKIDACPVCTTPGCNCYN